MEKKLLSEYEVTTRGAIGNANITAKIQRVALPSYMRVRRKTVALSRSKSSVGEVSQLIELDRPQDYESVMIYEVLRYWDDGEITSYHFETLPSTSSTDRAVVKLKTSKGDIKVRVTQLAWPSEMPARAYTFKTTATGQQNGENLVDLQAVGIFPSVILSAPTTYWTGGDRDLGFTSRMQEMLFWDITSPPRSEVRVLHDGSDNDGTVTFTGWALQF